MELAVNTFSKGMQLDTHPMVQGNDSLTDCLNGTFVTMNGNEIILQNDMGNRRVDNAFLPSGYEPIGVKEYGGIIYIAAYNPITNRSLIGSFPSPERKINEYDDEDLGNSIQYSYDLISNNTYFDESLCRLLCLKQDSILYPLTGKNSLHAGDKFVIYGYGDDFKEFSNCNNTYSDIYGDYVKTPKNKQYTLSVGILNSLNLFVDITKTLCRWGGSTLLNTDNKSEEFKFNYGYFIASSKPSIIDTINDRKLIEERLKIAVNTYAYKLVGPMYLKVHLNHIETFSYNIYGNTIDDEKTLAELYIEGFITYNCPDGISKWKRDGDHIYYTYDEGIPDSKGLFKGFTLYRIDNGQRGQLSLDSEYEGTSSSTYNTNTNLYTVKIVKKYNAVKATNGNIYNYVLGVHGVGNIYLSGLSTKGSIDFNLLGSGKVSLITWRFINNINSDGTGNTALTYAFAAYPKYGKSFLNLTFTFIDVKDDNKYILSGLQLNNGRSIITFDWGDLKDIEGNPVRLKSRRLYRVKISWDIFDREKEEIDERSNELEIKNGENEIFFLTTELFNDCYNLSSSNFIDNYVNPETEELRKIKEDKLNIRIGINYNLTNNSESTQDKISKKLININPSTDLSDTFYIKYEREFNLNLKSNPELYIINEHLYPEYIKINKNAFSNVNITNFKLDTNYIRPTIMGNNKGNNNSEIINSDDFIEIGEITNENNAINGKIIFRDLFKAIELKKNKEITNAFDSMEVFIKAYGGAAALENKYGGIYLDFDDVYGGDDVHYVNLIWNRDLSTDKDRKYFINSNYKNGELPKEDAIELDSKTKEDPYHSRLTDYILKFYDELNSNLKDKQLFIYGFFSEMELINSKNVKTNHNYYENPSSSYFKARVWWKTYDNKWALFYFPYDKKVNYGDNNDWKSLEGFLQRYLKSVIWSDGRKETYPIYCAYNSFLKDMGVPHDKNYAYNDRYSINIDGSIEYTYEGKDNFVTGNINSCLSFKASLDNAGVERYNYNSNWKSITYDSSYKEFDPNFGYHKGDKCNMYGLSFECRLLWLRGVAPIIATVNQKTTSVLPGIVELESSEDFLNEVSNVYSEKEFSCIDVITGNDSDVEGVKLDKNSFYYRTVDGLVKAKKAKEYYKVNPNITTYYHNNGEDYDVNAILYNQTIKKSSPYYKFDITGKDSDDFTSLDYSNIYVVNVPDDLT